VANLYSINYDGSVQTLKKRAASGGASKDHCGNVIFSFAINLGFCSLVFAELWPIFFAIELS